MPLYDPHKEMTIRIREQRKWKHYCFGPQGSPESTQNKEEKKTSFTAANMTGNIISRY